MMKNYIRLIKIAEVLPGHPFRGKIIASPSGDARVIQMKNASYELGVDWSSLTRVQIRGRKLPTWLQQGDIAFNARGINNYAIHLESAPERIVLSPHFFLIRALPEGSILPEFLAWQINQSQAKRYFASSTEGSGTVSIRKAILESLPIVLPSLKEQKQLIRLIHCWKKQQEITHKLATNNEQLMASIANKVFNKATEEVNHERND